MLTSMDGNATGTQSVVNMYKYSATKRLVAEWLKTWTLDPNS